MGLPTYVLNDSLSRQWKVVLEQAGFTVISLCGDEETTPPMTTQNKLTRFYEYEIRMGDDHTKAYLVLANPESDRPYPDCDGLVLELGSGDLVDLIDRHLIAAGAIHPPQTRPKRAR